MLRLTYQRAQGLSSGYAVEQQQQLRSKDRNGKCSCRDSDVEFAETDQLSNLCRHDIYFFIPNLRGDVRHRQHDGLILRRPAQFRRPAS
jgi:hypothetical protein